MRVAIVSRHLPHAEGSAGGRALFGLAEGLADEGHEVRVWSWGPVPTAGPLPPWCERLPLPPEPAWRIRARALTRPRWDAARLNLRLEEWDVAVADTPVSFAAVAGHPRSAVTVHYSARVDLRAVGRPSPARLQDVRAEARAVARAGTVTAYSDRVAAAVGHGAVVVPIAYPIPPDPLPPAAGAVAACVADWAWPANRFALGVLLRCWPLVRERVPSASLLIAGPGLAPGSLGPGMTSFGPVGSSAEILARACVVVFPCPATSGPKVKVLEALACGRAVVTTAAGIEGLSIGEGSGVATAPPDPASTAAAVIPLLADPGQASVLAREGRRSIAMVHGPRPAARRRVEAWSRPA